MMTSLLDIQAERFAKFEKTGLRTKAEAEGELLDKIAVLGDKSRELLLRATERLHLTAVTEFQGWRA